MASPDDIAYFRVRVASKEFDLAGRKCHVVEPVSKSGRAVECPWHFTIPTEWLIPLEEMRKAMKR